MNRSDVVQLLVLVLVLVLWLAGLLVGCQRGSELVWSETKDGFEQSYFREPNGPVYVKRKLMTDGCIFGDFPDNAPPTERKVACGASWVGTYGHQLVCRCVDAGP